MTSAGKVYLKAKLDLLLKALKEEQPGATKVKMTYSGSSDNGSFDAPEVALNGSLVDLSGCLDSAFTDFGYELLEELYIGWEINEGSWGCITIYDNGTVSVKHTDLQPVSDKLVLFEDE